MTQETGKNPCIGKAKREFLKFVRNVSILHNATGQEVDEKSSNMVQNRHKVSINVPVLFQDAMFFAVLQ